MANLKKWAWTKKANEFGLDPAFVGAMIKVESGGNNLVVRYEPRWRYFLTPEKWAKMNLISVETEQILQAMSWGPLQIMGTKLRELGFDGMLTEAINPEVSGHYSCKFLKQLVDKWVDLRTVAAAYNSGTPLIDPETKLFRNEQYVCKVMESYQSG